MNQETFTCENCHNVYPIQNKVMHSIHCKPVPQNTEKPKTVEKQPQTISNTDVCPKCGIEFPKNEMNDHLFAHRSEEEEVANGQNEPVHQPIQQQERPVNINQHQPINQPIYQPMPLQNQFGMYNTNVNPMQPNPQNPMQPNPNRQIITEQDGSTTEIIEEIYPNGKKTTKITRGPNGNISQQSIFTTSGGGTINTNTNFTGPGVQMGLTLPFSTGNFGSFPGPLRLSNINFNNIQDNFFSSIPLFNNMIMFNQSNLQDMIDNLNQPEQHPVPEQIINELPEITIDSVEKLDGDKKDCIICLTPFAQGDKALILPCIHFFHTNCIKDWFKTQNTCPICKFKMDSKSMEPQDI